MTYFEDLTPYEYSKDLAWRAGDVRNVGWLDPSVHFSQGIVEAILVAKLLELCKSPVNLYRGWHPCPFCHENPVTITDQGHKYCLGDAEIRVPTADGTVIYAAPNLIYHYVTSHRYRPPDEFLEALREMTGPSIEPKLKL